MKTKQEIPPILIAEDDSDLLELFQDFLSDQGLETLPCPDGLIAMENLKKATPDLLILDFRLPKFNGLEVYRLIRDVQKKKSVPILMVSGHEETAILNAIEGDKKAAFLPKPFSMEAMWNKICELVPDFRPKEWSTSHVRKVLKCGDIQMIPMHQRNAYNSLIRKNTDIPFVAKWDNRSFILVVQKYSDPNHILDLNDTALEIEISIYEAVNEQWVCLWPSKMNKAA